MSNVQNTVRRLFRVILDTIFPERCINCGLEGELICAKCLVKIMPAEKQACPVCARGCKTGEICNNRCGKETSLLGLTVACDGDGEIIRRLIRHFRQIAESKFSSDCLQRHLSNSLINCVNKLPASHHSACMVIIPEKTEQRVGRKFPLQLLADPLFGHCNIKHLGLLKWRRKAKSQRYLNREQRLLNVHNAMQALHGPVDIGLTPDAPLLLFDDIYTTGATMREAARALKAVGWQNIWALVLYREY